MKEGISLTIAEMVEKARQEKSADIIKNTLNVKINGLDKKESDNKINDPLFLKIKSKYENMDINYWNSLVDKLSQLSESVTDGKDIVIKKLLLEFSKHEKAYYCYGNIIENPYDMKEQLKKLKADLKKIDNELKQYEGIQISLF